MTLKKEFTKPVVTYTTRDLATGKPVKRPTKWRKKK